MKKCNKKISYLFNILGPANFYLGQIFASNFVFVLFISNMDNEEHDDIINYFLYNEYPPVILKGSKDSKKNYRKKMKKFKYNSENNKLFYHINNKV
jgi:hypothetical protein